MSRPRARLMVARSSGRPKQIVAQRAGDELIDLVADLTGHAADDGAGGDFVGIVCALVPSASNASGLRKPSIRPISSVGEASDRSDRSISVSIEWPKR